ncbi:type iii effector maj [Chrysochromulina tobinii]|uniref:Type iii effector maj n=1 Tax=Chrysochromulina tobinii TaxID=1460289 RepID=A0A0M0JJC3_9EUKA|nr:type iii effector maj [Chrysochromulina tobinii]|eukprot:KOO26679.1 type iii effector maj [Chrysochromulina sp. CCMP291]
MAAIEKQYLYTPKAFSCGKVASPADKNQGSAKLFSFAKLNKLSKDTTLQCFGRYYREDVLKNPSGADHGNIRNFMEFGWDGVSFPDGLALKEK